MLNLNEIKCNNCANWFKPRRRDQRYCSKHCCDHHYRILHKDEIRKQSKQHRIDTIHAISIRNKRYKKIHRKEINAYVKKKLKEDPICAEKRRAVEKHGKFIRYNKIPKICKECGSKENVQQHHEDYNKFPIMLCFKHHLEIHGKKSWDKCHKEKG